MSEDNLRDGQPCGHHGCENHVSHPCEKCGRIQAQAMPKECPFGGVEKEIGHKPYIIQVDGWWYVQCTCGARGPMSPKYMSVGSWNTRNDNEVEVDKRCGNCNYPGDSSECDDWEPEEVETPTATPEQEKDIVASLQDAIRLRNYQAKLSSVLRSQLEAAKKDRDSWKEASELQRDTAETERTLVVHKNRIIAEKEKERQRLDVELSDASWEIHSLKDRLRIENKDTVSVDEYADLRKQLEENEKFSVEQNAYAIGWKAGVNAERITTDIYKAKLEKAQKVVAKGRYTLTPCGVCFKKSTENCHKECATYIFWDNLQAAIADYDKPEPEEKA